MNLSELINVTSTSKAIEKAKAQGNLNLESIYLYNIYSYYINFTDNKDEFVEEHIALQNAQDSLKYLYTEDICSYDSVMPDTIAIEDDGELTSSTGGSTGTSQDPIVTSFSSDTISQETLFGSGGLYSTYHFNVSDFEDNYIDPNGDTDFYALIIYRDNLDNGALKYNTSATTGSVWGENANSITIAYDQIDKWSFYTSSETTYTHDIKFAIIDLQGTNQVESNIATLTINREAIANQPATIGDSQMLVPNRATTVLTLAMFTTNLAPPYNDPEGDVIDAIRIDEISTANNGVFKYDGVAITEGQIISKEDIEDELFTHEGPDTSTIKTDAINFSVRDSGSLIWVN